MRLTRLKDVYHSGDGGLYAELIQNRAFQGTTVNVDSSGHVITPFQTLDTWHNIGPTTLTLDNSSPILSDALPWQMRVDVDSGAQGQAEFWNLGFWGFNVTTATTYTARFYLRGDYSGDIDLTFRSNTTGSSLGTTSVSVSQTASSGWVKYEQTFNVDTSAPDEKNTFHIALNASQVAGSSVYFNLISVFPETWHGSKSNLRRDLADDLFALNGKFLRMPGGNNLEGQSSPYLWNWSTTVGPLTERPGRPGTWGYYNTDGFGLLEILQVCYRIIESTADIG
jgi:alpha-N-arabinofuranosidase